MLLRVGDDDRRVDGHDVAIVIREDELLKPALSPDDPLRPELPEEPLSPDEPL